VSLDNSEKHLDRFSRISNFSAKQLQKNMGRKIGEIKK